MVVTWVTISTLRSSETLTYMDDHQVVACKVRDLLTIELFPYWPREHIKLRWTSSDREVEAALYGLALAYQLIEGTTSYYE